MINHGNFTICMLTSESKTIWQRNTPSWLEPWPKNSPPGTTRQRTSLSPLAALRTMAAKDVEVCGEDWPAPIAGRRKGGAMRRVVEAMLLPFAQGLGVKVSGLMA